MDDLTRPTCVMNWFGSITEDDAYCTSLQRHPALNWLFENIYFVTNASGARIDDKESSSHGTGRSFFDDV